MTRDQPTHLPPRRGEVSISWPVVAFVVAVLIVAYWLRYVLLPFVAAGALAYIARPILHWLQRRFHFPRWLAALVPFLLFLGILVGLGFAIDLLLVPQLEQMMANLNQTLQKFLVNIFHGRDVYYPGGKMTASQAADAIIDTVHKAIGPSLAITAASTGFAAIMGFFLTIVIFAFLMFQGPRLAAGLLWLVPPGLRPRTRELTEQVDPMLGRYLRGVFLIVLYASFVTWIITGPVFHVSHAIFLAFGVGLLELIPVVGPIISFVFFGVVAVQQTGYAGMIGFGVFAILLRLSIDQLVGPLVLGRAAQIPPLVVIFAFLAGGALYGVLGVVLAIPAAAAVKIVLMNFYDEPEPDGPPAGEPRGAEPQGAA